ncbi:ABC transporter substrate-binding protein [Mannheimia massilioguelmaensis]|uniref:ABC transporter substrate-binding protein n=1 Tax=Mannheimia massilioguelmaensis TaxID=1604354 RepID=UPI0009E50E81|nr:ABC transporter substrate-binding protein [Mannheimia massilioguelmaensis]
MKKILGVISILLGVLCHHAVKAEELVIATSFSPETMDYISKQWETKHPEQPIRLINRTVSSLERLLTQSNIENVDLILSSSPFLFNQLQQKHYLALLPEHLLQNLIGVPSNLKQTTTAIAFSGYGIFYNKKLLEARHLSIPTDWDSLLDSSYANGILISSPSRSGTNHIMLEMLLQQRGWKQGWDALLTLSSNLSLISSRSFNVVDKVKMGLAVAGISIDTYALNQMTNSDLGFVYFPLSIASPTFISIHRNSEHPKEAEAFIQFLLSDQGQQIVATHNFAKYPLIALNRQDSLYVEQQKLFAQPLLDYDLLLLRDSLVEKLFDVAITFRLSQLKEVWSVLYAKEKKLGKKLTALRDELTSIPISDAQAKDKQFLEQLKNDRNFALAQEKKWAEYFQGQIDKVLISLEE